MPLIETCYHGSCYLFDHFPLSHLGAAKSVVAEFLNKIGVVYLAWPQSQTKPDGDTNRAVLNENYIRIVKIEQVDVDEKNKQIEGSERVITL